VPLLQAEITAGVRHRIWRSPVSAPKRQHEQPLRRESRHRGAWRPGGVASVTGFHEQVLGSLGAHRSGESHAEHVEVRACGDALTRGLRYLDAACGEDQEVDRTSVLPPGFGCRGRAEAEFGEFGEDPRGLLVDGFSAMARALNTAEAFGSLPCVMALKVASGMSRAAVDGSVTTGTLWG
jgi:hypothetical protein